MTDSGFRFGGVPNAFGSGREPAGAKGGARIGLIPRRLWLELNEVGVGWCGLLGVARTALKAVSRAGGLVAWCSWSSSPGVLCPRAEWSCF